MDNLHDFFSSEESTIVSESKSDDSNLEFERDNNHSLPLVSNENSKNNQNPHTQPKRVLFAVDTPLQNKHGVSGIKLEPSIEGDSWSTSIPNSAQEREKTKIFDATISNVGTGNAMTKKSILSKKNDSNPNLNINPEKAQTMKTGNNGKHQLRKTFSRKDGLYDNIKDLRVATNTNDGTVTNRPRPGLGEFYNNYTQQTRSPHLQHYIDQFMSLIVFNDYIKEMMKSRLSRVENAKLLFIIPVNIKDISIELDKFTGDPRQLGLFMMIMSEHVFVVDKNFRLDSIDNGKSTQLRSVVKGQGSNTLFFDTEKGMIFKNRFIILDESSYDIAFIQPIGSELIKKGEKRKRSGKEKITSVFRKKKPENSFDISTKLKNSYGETLGSESFSTTASSSSQQQSSSSLSSSSSSSSSGGSLPKKEDEGGEPILSPRIKHLSVVDNVIDTRKTDGKIQPMRPVLVKPSPRFKDNYRIRNINKSYGDRKRDDRAMDNNGKKLSSNNNIQGFFRSFSEIGTPLSNMDSSGAGRFHDGTMGHPLEKNNTFISFGIYDTKKLMRTILSGDFSEKQLSVLSTLNRKLFFSETNPTNGKNQLGDPQKENRRNQEQNIIKFDTKVTRIKKEYLLGRIIEVIFGITESKSGGSGGGGGNNESENHHKVFFFLMNFDRTYILSSNELTNQDKTVTMNFDDEGFLTTIILKQAIVSSIPIDQNASKFIESFLSDTPHCLNVSPTEVTKMITETVNTLGKISETRDNIKGGGTISSTGSNTTNKKRILGETHVNNLLIGSSFFSRATKKLISMYEPTLFPLNDNLNTKLNEILTQDEPSRKINDTKSFVDFELDYYANEGESFIIKAKNDHQEYFHCKNMLFIVIPDHIRKRITEQRTNQSILRYRLSIAGKDYKFRMKNTSFEKKSGKSRFFLGRIESSDHIFIFELIDNVLQKVIWMKKDSTLAKELINQTTFKD